MFKVKFGKKSMVLLVVMATLLVLISLTIAVLSLILSHARLTAHQVNRTKAYYAALAGMNLAMEEMRNGNWLPSSATTYCLCSTTTCPALCPPALPGVGYSCASRTTDIFDPEIPYCVAMTVDRLGSSIDSTGRKITVSTTYTSSYSY